MVNNCLGGIRVVEVAAWVVGPMTGMMMADLGADVIKIEPVGRGDPQRGLAEVFGMPLALPQGRHAVFEYLNRNKRSIGVNLKEKAGQQIVYDLVQQSDVFVTNLNPKFLAACHLDYGKISQYNPKLIYANASGFGLKGTDSGMPSWDGSIQARSGVMTASGEPGWPPVMVSAGVIDTITGIMLTYGIMVALVARERLGGQEVTTSMLGSAMKLQEYLISLTALLGKDIPKQSRAKANNPQYNYYQCKDGQYLFLGGPLHKDWPVLCLALGMPELEKDPRFEDASKRKINCEQLITILDKAFAAKTRAEWVRILRKSGFPFSPIQSVRDLFSDEQVLANQNLVDIDHQDLGKITLLGDVIKFSKSPGLSRRPAPHYAQHTEAVLTEICGYSWDKIGELKEQGII